MKKKIKDSILSHFHEHMKRKYLIFRYRQNVKHKKNVFFFYISYIMFLNSYLMKKLIGFILMCVIFANFRI